MKTWQSKFLIAFLALAGIASILWAMTHYSGVVIHPYLSAVFRWAAILALCGYSFVRRSLTPWIFAGMLVGAEIGYDLTFTSDPTRLKLAAELQILSTIFLKLIKTIIAPLIFSTLVVGIAGHSNLKQVGRMGLKAILYFEIATTLALTIGLLAINLTHAGAGASLTPEQAQIEKAEKLLEQKKDHNVVLDIFPENFAKAVVEGNVLQVVVFSVLFAIGLSLVTKPEQRKTMLSFCESLSEVMFKFTDVVMKFAPFAVGGAMAYTVSTMGLGVLKDLLMLVLTLYGALIAFVQIG